MLYAFHYKEKDSTKNKPHYTFSFLNDKGNYIGSYSIMGYYLYDVYVIPEFQGQGYCKQIVSHAVKRKKNLILDVDPDNIPAIKCYKRCGFKFVKELKNYHHPSWGKCPSADVLRFKHE